MGSTVSSNQSPELKRRKLDIEDNSIISETLEAVTQADALNFIDTPAPDQEYKVLKLSVNIQDVIDELSKINLKRLQQKFENQSVVIFITANNGTNFHIYWKSKDSQKVLSLKPYKSCFSETDKDLCEFVTDFLTKCLLNGHSGIRPELNTRAIKYQIEIHNLVDSRNYNLLLLASESGIVGPIETLLKYGIEPHVKLQNGEFTAQNLAWQGRHSNVVLTLCHANLTFPSPIDINECSAELRSFIETCQEFHKMIEEKNNEKLEEILKQLPKLRHFYDSSNKSALKASLDLKLIDMYEFLISKNLSFGAHENVDEIWGKFENLDKVKLRTINFKYLKNIPEQHINVLMLNTCLSHDEPDEEGKRKLILRAYRALNSDFRLKIILKIVAATKIFKIIFDFHRDSTYRIDPTTGPRSKGIFYFSGRIIVGAKQLLNTETENDTFGVLIHELCHYAMLTVYQNKSDPFAENDQEAKEEFEEIAESCEEVADVEPVIRSVFDYPEDEQLSELIVRAPQLIALYSKHPERLQFAIETFDELFNYYINIVIPAMERAIPEIEGRLVYKPTYTYGKLSSEDKQKVQNANIKYKSVKVKFVELFPENSEIFDALTSDHISMMLVSKTLDFDDAQFRYLEEKIVLKWENLTKKLKKKFLNSNLKFQGESIKFKVLFKLYPLAFDALTSQQIINVISGNELKIGEKFVSENKFYVNRKFILEDTKFMWFEYEYGHEYIYNHETCEEHVKNRAKDRSFKEFLEEFLKKEFHEILQIFSKIKQNYYFKKQFTNLNRDVFIFMHKNSIEIVEQAQNEKIFILSSEAGAGKTVTFEQLAMEIKSKFPAKWVSYIDLPRHTGHYTSSRNSQNLLVNIFGLKSDLNNFEVRIFEEAFKSRNLVLLWNAFDEISPNYNEFILNVVKNIHDTSTNVQYICTRPLYSDQLSETFKIKTWQLVPFDEETKKEFLREFFVFENVLAEFINENIEKVEKIVKKLHYDGNSNAYKFDTPLMLRLIAEIYKNEKLFESANIFVIFEAFVEKKIEIWLEKSKSSFSMATKLVFGGSLKTILQKFALLNTLQIYSGTTLVLKMKKLKIMLKEIPKNFPITEISRLGILFINGKNNFQFSHLTLSEFFVAQYFIENLFDVDGAVDSDEAELRLEMFFLLTQCYGDSQQVVTDFMSSYLQKRPQSPKKFNLTISELLQTKFKNFLIRMLDTNHPKVFKFLFDFFKPDHDLLVDLLHVNESETFYTAIFNPNYFAVFTNPEYIKNLAKDCLTEQELQKFLTGKNQKGKILLGVHFYSLLNVNKNHEDFNIEIGLIKGTSYWDFFPKVKEYLTVSEQKELFVIALSPKIYLFYDKLFSNNDFSEYEKMWKNFENLLNQSEMQDALGDALVLFSEICPKPLEGRLNFVDLFLKKSEKFLSNNQIFEMFLFKNILHEAHWDDESFKILWNFLSNHSNEEERKTILFQDDLDDKNFCFWYSRNELKKTYSKYQYCYFYYNLTPLKIFHRALTKPFCTSFNYTTEIYEKHFERSEIRELIKSNDFLYYVIGIAELKAFKNFASYLEELYKGHEKELKDLFDRKIEPINLSVFELIEDFRGIPHAQPKWFNNIKIISELYKKIKD